ncbi:MAG: precorrin-6y C5,15-methyltransferase (decarboxylating) subunit CbiE [Lachnospiraceae bacterium]|nr:precorrin-6y C5,15-methyltransferase (decarboxylating) subunit CbiE [Lachnospiraceae bacterium]
MIYLVGTGMGNRAGLSLEGALALEISCLLIGSKRLAKEAGEKYPDKKIYQSSYEPCKIMELIDKKCDINNTDVSILFSGDTGFYSGAARMAEYLYEKNIVFSIIPAISTYQYLSARIGKSYEDWILLSGHGRDINVRRELMKGRPLFLLTSGYEGLLGILEELSATDIEGIRLTVAKDLSYKDERIIFGCLEEIKEKLSGIDKNGPGLYALLIEGEASVACLSGAIPDEDFIRDEAPLTKQPVRSLILSALRIGKEDICLDIGGGSGGVTLDMAMHAGSVYSIELLEERAELIRSNIKKFKAYNTSLIRGDARLILEDKERELLKEEEPGKNPLPGELTKIFIGGSNGQLSELISLCLRLYPKAELCFTAIVLESLFEGIEALKAVGADFDILKLSASRSFESKSGHMMKAENDIYIVSTKEKVWKKD